MSILFVLLMFLLLMSVSYFRTRQEVAQPAVRMAAQAPRMQREYGFSIPEAHCFHPGHTWVLREGGESARALGLRSRILGSVFGVRFSALDIRVLCRIGYIVRRDKYALLSIGDFGSRNGAEICCVEG